MDHEGEVRQFPEVGGGNFGRYPKVFTTIVTLKGEPTKSGYLTFDPGGMFTINMRPKGVQV